MVKVTFGSVFSVISALSTFVFATPTDVASYTVSNVVTDNYIYSNGAEEPNEPVLTVSRAGPDTVCVLIIIICTMIYGPGCRWFP